MNISNISNLSYIQNDKAHKSFNYDSKVDVDNDNEVDNNIKDSFALDLNSNNIQRQRIKSWNSGNHKNKINLPKNENLINRSNTSEFTNSMIEKDSINNMNMLNIKNDLNTLFFNPVEEEVNKEDKDEEILVNDLLNINKLTENTVKNESKYSLMNIKEITEQLVVIAKKQTGCRFLQKLIILSNEDVVNKYFFPSLYPNKIVELCQNFFGNYFIQKLIPNLSPENLNLFFNLIIKNILKFSFDPHGTRVVQTLNLEIAKKPELLDQFTKALTPHMEQLINDHNGSFVLLNYASVVTYPGNEIIFNFLKEHIIEVSTMPNACCTLQKCIDLGNEKQRDELLQVIAKYSIYLISNQYGNYVIQFILSKNNVKINDIIGNDIINNIIFLAKQKYSSNVIEKCFDCCSTEIKNKIINKLCDETIIKDLLRDMYGNYVLQKAINYSDENTKQKFLNCIIKEINSLKYLPFGQKLITKLILSFPEIKNSVNIQFPCIENFNNNINNNNTNNKNFEVNNMMVGNQNNNNKGKKNKNNKKNNKNFKNKNNMNNNNNINNNINKNNMNNNNMNMFNMNNLNMNMNNFNNFLMNQPNNQNLLMCLMWNNLNNKKNFNNNSNYFNNKKNPNDEINNGIKGFPNNQSFNIENK